MLREALSFFTNTEWTVIGLVLFFVTFVAIVAWTYRRSARKFYRDMAHLPLDERRSDGDK